MTTGGLSVRATLSQNAGPSPPFEEIGPKNPGLEKRAGDT